MIPNYLEQLPKEIQAIFLAYPGADPAIIQMFLMDCEYTVGATLVPDFIARFGVKEFKQRLEPFLNNPSPAYSADLADCLASIVYDK